MSFLITSAAEVKAPKAYPNEAYTIFMGGVIDNGAAEPWAERVVDALADYNVLLLNPRRDDWDSSWSQTMDNEEFVQQVEWELQGQENADINLYVFGTDEKEAKKSKAPITLMELGLSAQRNKTVVCCPESYFRSGNVYVVCRRYNIPVYKSLDVLLNDLKSTLSGMGLKVKGTPETSKKE
jgi:hypothetical protein